MSADQFRDLAIVANAAGPVEAADDLLHSRCDWIACPTCGGAGRSEGAWTSYYEAVPCLDCDGTGHPTVAQVLAWGEAVATVAGGFRKIPGVDVLDAIRAVKP